MPGLLGKDKSASYPTPEKTPKGSKRLSVKSEDIKVLEDDNTGEFSVLESGKNLSESG